MRESMEVEVDSNSKMLRDSGTKRREKSNQ